MSILPWQAEYWQRIDQLIADNKLPHALLLAGHKGVGKRAFAEHLAKRLLCNNPRGSEPCGQCKTCELIQHETHPDLLHLSPEEAGKVIKVDQVRETIDRLHGTAQQGGYRVLIIDPAEEMNISAANALLKTLEEPGNNTLILLIAHQLGQVMPTIRSRCQRVEFSLPEAGLATDWLAEKLQLPPEKAKGYLGLAQGAPLTAYEWKSGGAIDLRANFLGGLADLLRARVSPVALAEKYQKEDLRLPLIWWQSLLGDIVRIQMAQDEQPRINLDMRKMVDSVAKQANASRVLKLYESVQVELNAIQRHLNPNKQLLLEKLFFDWKELSVK